MATNIGRSLDEIKRKASELDSTVRSLTTQNKLLDRSLKFEKNPFKTLTERAENTKQSITAVTQRIELLKEQQAEYKKMLEGGLIKQSTYDKLATDITRAGMQLSQFNAELKETEKTIALGGLERLDKRMSSIDKKIADTIKRNEQFDKSLKFDTNPLETLTKRVENSQNGIKQLTDKMRLLKEQQKEYDNLLKSGSITKDEWKDLSLEIQDVDLEMKQLNAEIKEANKTIALLPAQKFNELGTAIEGAGNKLKGLSATAGAVLGSLTAIGLSANKTADDLGTLSGKLGITAEELQYLLYIAEKTDVSAEQMQKSFVKVKDAIGTQLLGGTNAAVKALELLNITASDFDNDLDAFYAVGDALGKVEDSAIQAALANDIFGVRAGVEMVNFLNAGKDALKGYENELTNVGILSNEAVASVNGFNDSIDRIKESFKLAKNELGLALLPVMEQIASFLEEKFIPFINNLVDKFSKLSDETKGIIVGVLGFLTVLAPLLIIIGKITSGIGGIIGILPKLNGLLTTLSAHPIIAIIGLIAVLLTTLYMKNENFRNSINNLFKAFQPLLSTFGKLLEDLLTPMLQILDPILQLIGELAAILVDVLAVAINVLMISLIPFMFVLETILKLVQSVVTALKDLFTLNFRGFAENQKNIWSNWQSVDFAKGALSGFAEDSFHVDGEMSVLDFSDDIPKGNYQTSSNIDNSVVIETINVEANEYTSADELLDLISKKLAIEVQARS